MAKKKKRRKGEAYFPGKPTGKPMYPGKQVKVRDWRTRRRAV